MRDTAFHEYGRRLATRREKAAAKKLWQLLGEERRDVLWYHQVGSRLAVLAPHRSAGRLPSALTAFAARGLTRDLAYKALRFARAYDRAGAKQVSKLSWFTVVLLMQIKNKDQRAEVQQKVITEGWSQSRLEDELHELQGFALNRKLRGRKLRGGASPAVNLRNLNRATLRWGEMHDQVWSHRDTGLEASLGALEPDVRTRLRPDIEQAVEELARMRKAAGSLRATLVAQLRLFAKES